MIEEVEQIIHNIYYEKNNHLFLEACNKKIELAKGITDYIKKKGWIITEISDSGSPSKEWYIQLFDYTKGEFKVSYRTMLQVSKLVPVFYIQHEFSVENIDENRMSPVLDGFDGQAFTKLQANMHDTICKLFANEGYKKLDYSEMNEVVEGFKMPHNINFFGNQITVECLLFHDILGISNKG